MAEFDPGQLDQIEDALEHIDALDELALSPALTERLSEYQDVLGLCQEAFPPEEPSELLLADVIAEAHEVSRHARRDPEAGAWRKFWERWRGTLVPGFALASTAAAVLWILGPDPAQQSNDRLLEVDRPASENQTRSEPASEARRNDADNNADEPLENGEIKDDEDTRPSLGGGQDPDQHAEDPEPPRPTAKKKVAPEPVPEPEPAPEPLSKDQTWTELERANQSRFRGDCDGAQTHYENVINAGADNLALARAKAGIGLCLEQARRNSEANEWFKQARDTSPGIDAWINNQRDEQPLPGERKGKRPAQKSKKSKSDDPLEAL